MVDKRDEVQHQAVWDTFLPDVSPIEVRYEFHGVLWYGWAACVIQARGLEDWNIEAEAPSALHQVEARIVADVEIAHAFLGTCVAFSQLFRGEMSTQIAGYASRRSFGRSPQQLNRLRTLALAVVSVTSFERVTATDEDKTYFRLFENEAMVGQHHAYIGKSCEVLFNVQEAEFHDQQEKRDRGLGYILAGLTAFTIISVASDAYNFIRDQETIISDRMRRIELLVEFILGLVVVGGLLWYVLMRKKHW